MCFSYDAEPPAAPGATGAVSGRELTLTASDGTAFSAYQASPVEPSGAAVVVLPDVRGLFGFYATLAERFAAAGVEAVAIDYFGRTAGLGARDAEFEFMPHVQQTRPEQVSTDVAAAVAHLRSTTPARAIFTVGFCYGGGQSFSQAANGHDLAGVVGFYGRPRADNEWYPSSIDRVGQFGSPVLGLFGGGDQSIPAEVISEFDGALGQAGVEHTLHTYPGLPHSFFDRSYADYSAECADSWNRMLGFFSAHTPVAA